MSARKPKRKRSAAPKKGGRRRGQTSKAIARAAKENGANGGRPRDRLPEEVMARLGAPPATPKELRTWNAKLLAEVQWLCIKGEIGTELAATLRANAGSIDRALPAEPPPRPGDDEDEDDEEDEGPELESNAGDGGIRVGG